MKQLRKFARRTTDIPILFKFGNMIGEHEHALKNVGRGGLCFRAGGWIDPGTEIRICIPFSAEPCNLNGCVAWCRKARTGRYETGIVFDKTLDPTALRLIDQIETYKNSHGESHRLTSKEAARIIGAWS